MDYNPTLSTINRIAFIGNYLPRQCGIATFTTGSLDEIAAGSIAMSLDGYLAAKSNQPMK